MRESNSDRGHSGDRNCGCDRCHSRGRDREAQWKDLLAGRQVIRPWEFWLLLHDTKALSDYRDSDRAVIEYGLVCLGYKKQAVHPLQLDHDRFVWVREPWESDLDWEDLSDDPVWLAVMERYVANRARGLGRVPH
jgi:hypothetical protein